MSHHPQPLPSPRLSSALYTGMSSLRIGQPGAGYDASPPPKPTASQPQKSMLRVSKAERAQHDSRRSDPYPSAPGKCPRQAAALSSGRKHLMKDDASFRQTQLIWSPFPSDARPTSRKETTDALNALAEHITDDDLFIREQRQEIATVREMDAEQGELIRHAQRLLEECRHIQEARTEELLRRIPDAETRQRFRDRMEPNYAAWREAERRNNTRIYGDVIEGSSLRRQ